MVKQRAQGVVMTNDPLFGQQRHQIAELALKHRIPCLGALLASADAGLLLSYGQNIVESYRRAATYVDRIIRGAKPADLPLAQPKPAPGKPARAGEPVRVGILERTTQAKYRQLEKTFVDAMRELGWVEGRNVVYDRVYADDDAARLSGLATALVKRGPDLVYTASGEPAQAAFASTRT